ncbi:peptide ABC transporter substrate-binding protein [Congregibacter brevis]|uniref:Peptide ABC transporter substrate-binding protein n=1 Tax=Congregibacter brevis TaxID=3081201 RepID=A0ABZ0I8X4_9GAMM|nr:peptide ABC transporter substrate-binding protein [Congregibacter sp. IMCC45268]
MAIQRSFGSSRRGLTRILLFFCALSLYGCSQESRVLSGNRAGILHVSLPAKPQTLDPHVASGTQEYMLISALFEPLTVFDAETLTPEPGAAERWVFDTDGLGATFFLRKDLRWSNGDAVTARDFVFAWRRALNPKLGNQLAETLFHLKNAEEIYSDKIKDVSMLGVSAMSERTLRLEFAHPVPELIVLENLSHAGTVPLHAPTLERYDAVDSRYAGWARTGRLVGNGAFTLDEWRMQRDVSLKANPLYWNAASVGLNGITFYPIESITTEEKLFRSGQLHLTTRLPASKVPSYRDSGAKAYIEQPISRSDYIAVNMSRPPLDDPKVRRALALAIDRPALAQTLYHGAATPIGGYVPTVIRDYPHPTPLKFDPETARRLMTEAGYPNGKGFPEISLLTSSDGIGRNFSTAAMQGWRDKLNIRVKPSLQEYRVYLDSLIGGDFDLVLASWNGAAQPQWWLDRWRSDSPTNDSRYSNARFDDLVLKKAKSTADTKELLRIYADAETLLMNDLPIIPLFQRHSKYLKQPSVKGMPANPINVINFERVALNPDGGVWETEAPLYD